MPGRPNNDSTAESNNFNVFRFLTNRDKLVPTANTERLDIRVLPSTRI